MAQRRKKFSPTFKTEAIWCVLQTGRPVAKIARELEIDNGTFPNLVNVWKLNNPEPLRALSPVERLRMAEMETEIRRLRMENEFLKKRR